MKKVSVVILNYLNYLDTIECVESVKNQNYKNLEIVIVDNGSTNESWDELRNRYNNKNNIHLIRSDENLGFSKGNNLGIEYSTNNLLCKYVLVVNNDTIFEDSELITRLMLAYEPGIGMIGPRIIDLNKNEQNPMNIEVTKKFVQDQYKYLTSKKYKILNSKIADILKKNKFLVRIKKKFIPKNNFSLKHTELKNYDLENVILHGACFLLTEDYFLKYPYLYSKTFLYYEEIIMAFLLRKANLKTKYVSNCYLLHKEDQSSLMSFNNLSSIKLKYQLESMKRCIELIDESYDEIRSKYFKIIN